MMQITAELSMLSKPQRDALAAFIVDYPSGTHDAEPQGDEERVEIPAFAVHPDEPEIDAELPASPDEAFAAAPGPVLVPAPPAAVTATALDKAGLPWDERIHASSRSFTADGCWRKKRGVSSGLVTEVETQLRSLMAIPSPPASGAVPAPPTQATTLVPAAVPPAPTAAPSAVPAAPAPVAASADKTPFIQLISKASAAIAAKKLTQEQVNSVVVSAGVPSLPLLANRLDLVPQVAATIETLIAANA